MTEKRRRPVCFGDYYLSGAYVEQCNICEFKAECEQAEQQAFVKRSMEYMGLEYMEPTSEDDQ